MSTRRTKTQRKADLRKKNLGLLSGVVDVDAAAESNTKPNKILFGDDFVASDYENDEADTQTEKYLQTGSFAAEEGSSDDEVEQVSASAAKKQAMELLAAERKTRKEEKAFASKRKRKSKEIPAPENKEKYETEAKEEEEDDDQILNDEFFSMVDEERKNEAKAKKQQIVNNTVGKHTTFVSDVDDTYVQGSISAPIHAGHNIQVVVLPDLRSEGGAEENRTLQRDKYLGALSASLGTAPSKAALMLCRGSQMLQKRNENEKGFEVKRSRKMKYRLTRGRPNSIFSVTTSK